MGKKNTTVGLDIGTHAVKAVWCEALGKRLTITRSELLRLPSGIVSPVSALQPWVEKHNLRKFSCVLGLPGQKCIFQPFSLNADDTRTYAQAAAVEVLKFNEMASETMLHSHAPFSLGGEERRMLLAMARPGVVNDVLGVADALKLHVVDLVPAPVAVFHALRSPSAAPNEVTAHIQMGSASTELAIGRGADLVFARTFASGGQMFTDNLARQLSVSAAQAETMKTSRGNVSSETQEGKALASSAQMWVNEAASCLAMYRSLFPGEGNQPTSVVLSGPAAALEGLPALLAKRVDLPVRTLDKLPGGIQGPKALVMAQAAGLATLGHHPPEKHLSLLPPRLRNELTFKRQKPFWIGACIVGALILGVSVACGYEFSKRQQKLLKEQSESLARRQALVTRIENQKLRTESLIQLANPVKNLVYAGPLMRDLITLVAESTAPTDWISLISDGASYFDATIFDPEPQADERISARELRRRSQVREQQQTEASVFERVIVEGYTRDRTLKTVHDLIEKLRASDFIIKADLLPDDRTAEALPPEVAGSIRFVIDLEVVTR